MRYCRISVLPCNNFTAASKGLDLSALSRKSPIVLCEAIVNICLSQSSSCCRETFDRPRGCSLRRWEKSSCVHPSIVSKLAKPARSMVRLRLCHAERNLSSVFASHVGSAALDPSLSIPDESVETVGSFLIEWTSWARLQHCSGLMYDRMPDSHISTKRSTKWFAGIVSGVNTSPPNLPCCSRCRATLSAVAIFLVAIAGSGWASTRCLASVIVIVCASKNRRLRIAIWSASGSSSKRSVKNLFNGVSSAWWGE